MIYTDVWTSMGQEAERLKRLKDFAPVPGERALLKLAPKHAVLHCLPAHRGEITDDAIEGPRASSSSRPGTGCTPRRAVLEWLME